jgi:hypothetical protein
MELDLATFLTALYCVVDDLYRATFAPVKPVRPGHAPEMADSEVLTVLLLAQWAQRWSERDFLAYVARHWRGYFPRLLSQSAFNRRARDLALVVGQLGPLAAQRLLPLLDAGDYELLDGMPVPLLRRCRGDRHRLFAAEAGIGRGGSDRAWYYGVKLVSKVSAEGIITGFVLSPAPTEERWAVEALLAWGLDPTAPEPDAAALADVLGPAHRRRGERQGPTGPIRGRLWAGPTHPSAYVADLGEHGAAWQAHRAQAYGAHVLTPDVWAATWEEPRRRAARRDFRSRRQLIETVHATLEGLFAITFPRARTFWGLLARLAAKVAAYDLLICLNHRFGRPTFAHFNPFVQQEARSLA